MNRCEIERRLTNILRKQNESVNMFELSSDKNLIELCNMDSMKLITFILEIESEFGIEFNSNDLIISNFEVLDRIVELVSDKVK